MWLGEIPRTGKISLVSHHWDATSFSRDFKGSYSSRHGADVSRVAEQCQEWYTGQIAVVSRPLP